jgi:hypothetical protein
VSTSFLQRALVGGSLIATIAVAGMTGGSSATFSPDTVVSCKSDATCSTIEQTGTGQALVAQAAANNGSVGTTKNPSKTSARRYSGVWGLDISKDGGNLNVGVTGSSTNGSGMLATSANYVGLEVKGGNPGSGGSPGADPTLTGSVPALAVTGGSHSAKQAPPPLIDGCSSGGPVPCTDSAAVFKVANNGAITVASCTGCASAPTRTSAGRRVDAFASRVTVPTIEDVGEGRVSEGRGYVRIDPAFAETMDRSQPYLVMLTPEGPSHGLYVAERSPSGFSVRENPGGASTLAFTYRIVAKPFDTAAQRLPVDNSR